MTSMTPDALRDIAWALEQLARLMGAALSTRIAAGDMGAGTATITFDLTNDDEPLTVEAAEKLLAWVSGTDMQDDLRAWADDLERS